MLLMEFCLSNLRVCLFINKQGLHNISIDLGVAYHIFSFLLCIPYFHNLSILKYSHKLQGYIPIFWSIRIPLYKFNHCNRPITCIYKQIIESESSHTHCKYFCLCKLYVSQTFYSRWHTSIYM